MHGNKKLYIKIHRNMHKNQKNHLLSQIKPCILNQSENVPIRQCTAPARNIFAKQPLENAGTWQGERKQSRA